MVEGRLYDLLDAAADTRLHNGNRPSDETLPPYERAALASIVPLIRRVLRLLGYDTETPDDQVAARPAARTRSNRFYGITVKQLLDAGLLTAGETLTSTNSVYPATAALGPNREVRYNGTAHPSPSNVAGAVRGGLHANGWEFWAAERPAGRVTLATLRARFLHERGVTCQLRMGRGFSLLRGALHRTSPLFRIAACSAAMNALIL